MTTQATKAIAQQMLGAAFTDRHRNAGFFEKAAPVRRRRARGALHDYTSEQLSTTRHWSAANALNIVALHSSAERSKARNRSRYEERENAYYTGIVWTLVDDIVGASPRLQMLLEDEETNQLIEKDFSRWAKMVKFVQKVRTAQKAYWVDGESFIVKRQNPKLPDDIQLDLWLIETDQVTDSYQGPFGDDGIMFDEYDNPVSYNVLINHPGGVFPIQKSQKISALDMIHYFRMERAGQRRGFPAFRASFEVMAQLRDFTLSVIKSARSAADVAGVITSKAPDLNDEESEVINPAGDDELEVSVPSPMDVLPIERGVWLTLPEETNIAQLKAEQPTTTYGEFKGELINEIARPVSMPYNVAACNSSGYNYASGRMDHQKYDRFITVRRRELVDQVLDNILSAWMFRWVVTNNRMDLIENNDWAHTWYFDPAKHVDPVKEANGQNIRLQNDMTNVPREKGNEGIDWREDLRLELEYEKARREMRSEMELPEEIPGGGSAPNADDPDDEPARTPPASQRNRNRNR